MKSLYDICEMVIDVEEGLMTGEIPFVYDNLMSAMKPGHPMEILDNILAEIFWDVQANKEPPLEKVIHVRDQMKAFRNAFKVTKLNAAIKEMTAYIVEKGGK